MASASYNCHISFVMLTDLAQQSRGETCYSNGNVTVPRLRLPALARNRAPRIRLAVQRAHGLTSYVSHSPKNNGRQCPVEYVMAGAQCFGSGIPCTVFNL
jgi:hypothetical protein